MIMIVMIVNGKSLLIKEKRKGTRKERKNQVLREGTKLYKTLKS